MKHKYPRVIPFNIKDLNVIDRMNWTYFFTEGNEKPLGKMEIIRLKSQVRQLMVRSNWKKQFIWWEDNKLIVKGFDGSWVEGVSV